MEWYAVNSTKGDAPSASLDMERRLRAAGYPGAYALCFEHYVIVGCPLDEETWEIIRSTPKTFGFTGGKPCPLRHEVRSSGAVSIELMGSTVELTVRAEEADAWERSGKTMERRGTASYDLKEDDD